MRRESIRRLVLAGSTLALTLLWGAIAPSLAQQPTASTAVAKPAKKDSRAAFKPKGVTLTPSVKPTEAKAGDIVTYQIAAKLAPEWHIYKYTKTLPEKGPRPTQFDFFDTAGLRKSGDWVASTQPISRPEPAFENMILEFYEHEVTWSIKLVVPTGTKPGPKTLRCQVGYQICDPHSCSSPGQWTLPDVTVTVLPGGSASTDGASPPVASDKDTTEVVPPEPGPAPAPVAEAKSEVALKAEQGIVPFLLASALGGLLALAMPCVWPMVPITVNFFVKQGQAKQGRSTVGLAIAYCLAIIGVFTTVGVLCSFFFSAAALSRLANNPWLNFGVAALFLVFGLSLLGLFEVRLPNFLLNASAQGEGRGGLIGVGFMALTLTITSFTCTFPVVGGLLVMAAGGQFFYPIIGLATFSTVVALPFFLLALSPGLLSKMPKSGDWMNAVKVVGGLVEVGAAFKFINTAECAFVVPKDAWFNAPAILTVWVVLALVCGIYLLGLFRTDHDHDEVKVGPGRIIIGVLFLSIALFLTPALFGKPAKGPIWYLIVGLLPADAADLEWKATAGEGGGGEEKGATSTDPKVAATQQKAFHGVVWGMSYDAALAEAKAKNKPVLIDFTGVNCANCRKMESEVLPREDVVPLLEKFVTIQLYTDYPPLASLSPDVRKTLGTENLKLELKLTQDTTNPFYVVLSPAGKVLGTMGGYRPSPVFIGFLNETLTKHEEGAKVAQAEPGR